MLKAGPWLGFTIEITRALRTSPGNGMTEAQLKAQRGADVVGFKFKGSHVVDGVSRTLKDYDMVLYFACEIGDPNAAVYGQEAEAIAAFMEGGGGFFATGDHQNFGAPICGLIPRVRSMRRWWFNNPPAGQLKAPAGTGSGRIDTTRPGTDNVVQFEDQSDEIAQVITPKLYPSTVPFHPQHSFLPHPLLCSPIGIVNVLPDHMHEGRCEVPGNLGALTYTVGGHSHREYPDAAGAPLAPEIVATSRVVAGTTTPALDPVHTTDGTPTPGFTFGAICAWDGHRVLQGRVVVDSTFHHFFDINLTGDRYLDDNLLPLQHQQKRHGFYVPDGMGGRVPSPHYKLLRWYFINIVYWLIPADRHPGIVWNAMLDLVRRPQLNEELATLRQHDQLTFGDYMLLAGLADQYFNIVRNLCFITFLPVVLARSQPDTPWWQWVKQHADVWDPQNAERRDQQFARERSLAALGVGPRPQLALRLSVGAAVATAALVRHNNLDAEDVDGERLRAEFDKQYTETLDHALGLYAEELAAAREVQDSLTARIEASRGQAPAT